MGDTRSSQKRGAIPGRDSSATRVRIEVPGGVVSTASSADDQATIISSRPLGSESSAPPLLRPLEVGKLLEGEQLGQFELRQFVGGGGMGVVFRGWDTTLNREVAVKVLSRDQSADDETRRRFRNEAQSAARLDHANIARVYYVGEDRGVHYIVFEFIEGVNLRDLVDRHGPLPIEEAIAYTQQVAEALDHASQRDVIHRDIKPSNVLITAEGKAKLVDMGLARLHQVEHTNDDLTASGVTLGTFDYISPEQARDPRSADVRSDLYSLGCSLYFMLVGQPPFPHGTVLQKLLQHQGEEPSDPRTLRPELPPELVRILRKLLAKSPTHRYQQPADLIAELNAFLARLSAAPESHKTAAVWALAEPLKSPRWRKHIPWLLPIAALALISLALDLYWSRLDAAANLNVPLPAIGGDAATSSHNSQKNQASAIAHNTPAKSRGVSSSKASPGNPNSTPINPTANRFQPLPGSAPSNETKTSSGDAAKNSTKLSGASDTSATTSAANVGTTGDWSPTTAKDAHPITKPDGLLVVGDVVDGGNFPTIASACRAAKNGDVIELRYDGPRDETPLSIVNLKLAIRAGEGFSPIVRIHPDVTNAMPSIRSMITVSGGSISLMNVAIEFEPPRDLFADRWALFEVQQADLVRFERSSLTIRNAGEGGLANHPNVVFFLVSSLATVDAPSKNGSNKSETPVTLAIPAAIELQNCVARGEATFLRVGEGQSARVFWDNGLLATTERLLWARSGMTAARRMARVELEARHLTAEVRNGLAWFDFSAGTQGFSADLRLSASIVRVSGGTPMIEQVGFATRAEADTPINWSGDRNFYEGIDTFWNTHTLEDLATGERMAFAKWQEFWGNPRENLPSLNAVVWSSLPSRDRATSEHSPIDYALSNRSANNPARDSASDGLDAGFLMNLLPSVPTTDSATSFPPITPIKPFVPPVDRDLPTEVPPPSFK